jgi:predicted nucleic acid-binding protein
VSLVLDNSVALAWCFEAEQTPPAMEVLGRVARDGAVAPMLWPLEAQNGLLMAVRRQRLDMARMAEIVGFLRDLPIALDQETADRAWRETAALAANHGLTVYDTTYLELAMRRGLPLATTDRTLRAAAEKVGVSLLGQ